MTAPEDSISTIIPAYNAARFLADAIESVLAQTLSTAELIVIDDASTDATALVARRYPGVRYLRLADNQGQAAAINTGVAASVGRQLAFLDADDTWVTEKLECQWGALRTEPELEAVYGWARERVELDQGMGSLRSRHGRILPAQLPSALLIRREAWQRVGGLDTRYTLGSVVDWYARALEAKLVFRIVPHVVYERRIHGANLGLERADRRADYFEAIRNARRRQRLGEPNSRPQSEELWEQRDGADA